MSFGAKNTSQRHIDQEILKGNCLSVTWKATHPDINNPSATVSAAIIEKTGLGYNDALTWQAKRKSGVRREEVMPRPGPESLSALVPTWRPRSLKKGG
jgi:hypothetical protein